VLAAVHLLRVLGLDLEERHVTDFGRAEKKRVSGLIIATWDRCYDFLNIFAAAKKIGVFDTKQS
jgi:hypothetical protein